MVLIEHSNHGKILDIETPKGRFNAEIVEKPFYDPNKKIANT